MIVSPRVFRSWGVGYRLRVFVRVGSLRGGLVWCRFPHLLDAVLAGALVVRRAVAQRSLGWVGWGCDAGRACERGAVPDGCLPAGWGECWVTTVPRSWRGEAWAAVCSPARSGACVRVRLAWRVRLARRVRHVIPGQSEDCSSAPAAASHRRIARGSAATDLPCPAGRVRQPPASPADPPASNQPLARAGAATARHGDAADPTHGGAHAHAGTRHGSPNNCEPWSGRAFPRARHRKTIAAAACYKLSRTPSKIAAPYQ